MTGRVFTLLNNLSLRSFSNVKVEPLNAVDIFISSDDLTMYLVLNSEVLYRREHLARPIGNLRHGNTC